jgi:hypothetical protein
MKTAAIEHKWLILMVAATLSTFVCQAFGDAEVTVRGRITQEAQDGVYVDVGIDQGLRSGRTGSLHLDDGRTFAFEVLHAGEQSAVLRLPGYRGQERLVGRTVEIVLPQESLQPAGKRPEKPKDPNGAPVSSNTSGSSDGQKEFVPLLAPTPRGSDVSRLASMSHGRIQVRQMFQMDSGGNLGYSVTRVGSSGSMDRIEGSPWSFNWSGDLRYRTGDAFVSHPDYQEPHLDIYRAMFQRPLGEEAFLRFGRFVPYELPGIGYVDGLQGQVHPGEHTRLGVVGGLKPDRINLDASADEPLVVPYATFVAGPRDGRHYSGTVGMLNSYYDGQIDRLAMLLDQRAGLGHGLTLYSTAVVDFDIGASEMRSGTRLTQLDVSAVSQLSSFLTLRAGVDHWERPDHQAENALLPFQDERFFDNGYWRYWVGSSQNIPWNLRLYEEVGFINSDTVSGDVRWQVSLTRSGLGAWREASATVTVYNLVAYGDDGYGCRVSGHLPLNKGTIIVQPAAGFRVLQADSQSEDISLSYLSVGLDGRISHNWSLFGDATYFSGDNADSTLFELGLRFAW